ncbi:cytochrome P450 4V2, partial [Ixodes scapularis]
MLPAIQVLLSFVCLFLGGAALLLLSVLGAFHAARRATWKHVKALPGPDGSIPLLWIVRQHFRIARVKHMVPYNVSTMETHLGICSQYQKKGIYRFYVGNQLHVMIFKPELIESVLTSPKTMSKSFNYSLLHSWLGTGLLT